MDAWKKVKIPSGGKLLKVHNFAYMHKGNTYYIEIDEFHDGTFSGHGEHSTDKSCYIESVTGKSLHDCVEQLMTRIETRAV